MGVLQVMELLHKTVEQFFIRAFPNLANGDRIKFLYLGMYGGLRDGIFFRRFTLGK